MKTLVVARKDFLRSVRNVFFLVFGVFLPLLMAMIFYFAFGGSGGDEDVALPQTNVRVVNLDRPVVMAGSFSAGQTLVEFLQMDAFSEILAVEVLSDTEAARAAVDGQEAAVAVIIPADLTVSLFDPEGQAAVEVYQDPTLTVGPGIVKAIVTQFVDTLAGSKIAVAVASDRLSAQGLALDGMAIQQIAMQYSAWSASLSEGQQEGASSLIAVRSPGGRAQNGLQANIVSLVMAGMMVFYAFFTGSAGAMTILQEEENGTLSRAFTTPTRVSAILGGKFIAVFATIALEVCVLVVASGLLFEIDWGAPLPLAIALVALVVVAASFGIFVTSLLKGTKQTGIVYGGVMSVMGMMGMVSVFTAGVPNPSPAVKSLPLIVPQGWAVQALHVSMDGGGVEDVLPYVAVILVLAAAFFVVGVLKFRKRFA